MHYIEPLPYEPEFNGFDSYYLTWYDSSHSSDGPYGEPLRYTRDELSDESNSVNEEAGEGFLSLFWYSENRLTDQAYDTIPYNGGSNWVDEYKSYFASCWEEDMAPRCYGDREYGNYNGCLEKAEVNYEGGNQERSFYSYNDGMEGADSNKPWPAYHLEFVDGVKDNYGITGKQDKPPGNNDNDTWVYTRLWESIFGYWPCLQHLYEERPPDLLLASNQK